MPRYNRKVLLLHRGYGGTSHAAHIENFLGHEDISGKELLEIGLKQAESFEVEIKNMMVKKVLKKEVFEVHSGGEKFSGRYVIVASGILDVFPEIENIYEFLGDSYFTCITCDGYKTINKKLAVIGNSDEGSRLSLAMKELYTEDITFISMEDNISEVYKGELRSEGIGIVMGNPKRIIGDKYMGQ